MKTIQEIMEFASQPIMETDFDFTRYDIEKSISFLIKSRNHDIVWTTDDFNNFRDNMREKGLYEMMRYFISQNVVEVIIYRLEFYVLPSKKFDYIFRELNLNKLNI